MKKNIFFIFVIAFGLCGYAQGVFASSLTQVTDIMTRLRTNTPADHEIQFTIINGVGLPGKGDTILINFGNAVSNTNNISYEDTSLKYGAQGQELSQALYTIPGPNVWGVSINSQTKVLTLTFPTSNGTPITTGQRVIIKIGTSVRSNANQLINGSTSGSHSIEISAGDFDRKQIAIALLENDSVGAGAPVVEIPIVQQAGAVSLLPQPISTPKPSEPSVPVQPAQPVSVIKEEPVPVAAPIPIVSKPSEPSVPVQPAQPVSVIKEEPVPSVPSAPIPIVSKPSEPSVPVQPAPPPASIIVSLGAPASVLLQANKVASASVINTDATGQTTGFFAEIEKNTVAEDGKVTIEPIIFTQVPNIDSEIRIPSGKDVPDKVFYKINISTKVEKPIRITIKYNLLLLAGVDPTSLKINYWDGEKKKWIALEDTVINVEQATLSAYVIPQTIFAAFATITSRKEIQKRDQITIKSFTKFIPRNSGISQTDLLFSQKTDAEPVRFVNDDFYISGGRELTFCIQEKLFLKPVSSVFLDFMNKQKKLSYSKTFKCFSGSLISPIDEGTYPMKLKVLYKDDYSEIISPNLVVTTPLQAFIKPILRWVIEDIQSSPLATAGVTGSLILFLLGVWFAIDRRLRTIRMISPILSVSKK